MPLKNCSAHTMTDSPTVAAIQMTTGADRDANLAAARALLEQAARQGASVAGLPENFAFMGLNEADKQAIAEQDGDGPIQRFLSATARELGLWIVGGTIPIRTAADGRVASASLVFDAGGERRARYDKIHLFDVRVSEREAYRESATVVPGSEPTLVDSPAGRLGLSVCYDMRFPELFRRLSDDGARILFVPSAFTAPTGRAHWQTLLRARAIENLCYVVAPAQSGIHANGRETYGDSMIVDFWGRVVTRLPRGTGVISARVDAARQDEARRSFPALEHRVFRS
jgi:deaminated glutathione amidase